MKGASLTPVWVAELSSGGTQQCWLGPFCPLLLGSRAERVPPRVLGEQRTLSPGDMGLGECVGRGCCRLPLEDALWLMTAFTHSVVPLMPLLLTLPLNRPWVAWGWRGAHLKQELGIPGALEPSYGADPALAAA